MRTDWVFRGLADSSYSLEPIIERQARSKNIPWLALEKLIASEFKSRSRMHLDATLIPEPQDEFTWLAQMQHYGIPTRLLDFTYSPFVALYFAVRQQQYGTEPSNIRLWAIDAVAVNKRFRYVASIAEARARERAGGEMFTSVSTDPDYHGTAGDSMDSETQELQVMVKKSLVASDTYKVELKRQGCVAVASPPTFNPRLASQQGAFLVNFAEELNLCESLKKMMEGYATDWCKCFDIIGDSAADIKRRLFQMNVHEQSLFPDMEGLAGFIHQKIRLHWK